MNSLIIKGVPFLLFMCSHLCLPGSVNAINIGSPLSIQIDSVPPARRNSTAVLFVTARNNLTSIKITNVTIQVDAIDTFHTKHFPFDIEANQSRVEIFRLKNVKAGHFITVTYNLNGVFNQVVKTIEWPGRSNIDFLLFLPLFGTILGTALGAWLVDHFSSRREKARAKFDWGKMLFEKYERGYRDFLRQWNSAPSSLILSRQFETLRESCLVPSLVIDAYNKTFSVISNSSFSPEEKLAACISLQTAIENFLREPW